MTRSCGIAALVVLSAGTVGHAAGPPVTGPADSANYHSMETRMKRMTPILTVESIEAALPFWESLGFDRTAEVPEGDHLAFVSFEKDGIELMYQTVESVSGEMPALAAELGPSLLFVEVEDLDAVEAALKDFEVLRPRRSTFYGSDETVFREPTGNVVTFAQFAEEGD